MAGPGGRRSRTVDIAAALNAMCRRLATDGRIKRWMPPTGKILNRSINVGSPARDSDRHPIDPAGEPDIGSRAMLRPAVRAQALRELPTMQRGHLHPGGSDHVAVRGRRGRPDRAPEAAAAPRFRRWGGPRSQGGLHILGRSAVQASGNGDRWLTADEPVHHKQHHTARPIHARLRDEHGFGGAESTVRAFVRGHGMVDSRGGVDMHRWWRRVRPPVIAHLGQLLASRDASGAVLTRRLDWSR
jgi:hypothetical protein